MSLGDRTTKMHAFLDAMGRSLQLVPTPGLTSDVRGANLLVADAALMKQMIADRGHDVKKPQATLRD